MNNMDLYGKKLLILGANPETVPLVEKANELHVKTLVTSNRKCDMAKKFAWKSCDVDGMDVPGLVTLAHDEKVDGVLVGVADILVPSYYKVCEAMGLPCYASKDIVDIFNYKDRFKSTCEQYGIHGVPEYNLDEGMDFDDVAKIEFPVMVKPVDSYSGVGMTKVLDASGIEGAVKKALAASPSGRFIVEKYMDCEDMGLYYTFQDGYCSASCIYDRYTSSEQEGVARVCLGGTYPSRHIDRYFNRMHQNAVRMFRDIGIKNGVLMLSAFYKDGEFYVYDTGFRLQGEAPHLFIEKINGIDQREMLIRFALTGNEGGIDLYEKDNPYFPGRFAATVWILLKEGIIGKIEGMDDIANEDWLIANIQRLYVGDKVEHAWIGTEKQVFARYYIVCDSKDKLAECIKKVQEHIKVIDTNGNPMVLPGFHAEGYKE